MAKKLQVYETPEITVSFDPNLCKHSGVCLGALPAVFDVRRQRWVQPDQASASEVADAVQRCPSGALQFYRNLSRDPAAAAILARRRLLNRLAVATAGSEDRVEVARAICEAIIEVRGYDFAAVFDVAESEISVVGWAGKSPPDTPRFAMDRGLCGAAVRGGETVIVNDVSADARYLPTSASTRSEMIVPVMARGSSEVIGTIDVASNRVDAFGVEDREIMEDCAHAVAKYWAGQA